MTELARFGISIDQSLLDNFDQMITTKGYDNRSEAIRDMIRGALVEDQVENADTTPTVGTVTLGL
jgi:CopG family nickel-responsive transcriptional regulator